jgi:hypothetical protein
MGQNSFRNLTYAAVLAVVGCLVYLIYKSTKNKQRLNPSIEATSGLSGYSDTLSSIAGSSSAALPMDTVTSSYDGQIVNGAAALGSAAAATTKGIKDVATEVKEVIADDPGSLSTGPDDAIASSEKKKTGTKAQTVTAKGITTTKAKAKFDAGVAAGQYMAIAGAFASKDNADGYVAKLRKAGFTKAEAVKLENSSNVYVVAGYYEFKGGADAAARTLKSEKLSPNAYVKKKSGDIYKPVPASTPKTAVTPVKSKPI